MDGYLKDLKMPSPPTTPGHLQVRKLTVTNEEGSMSQQATPGRKSGKKIAALVGEDEMSGPPSVSSNQKNRFRNGHASFRLRMLQEQHGTGFEPVDKHKFKPSSVPTSPAASGSRLEPLSGLDTGLLSQRQVSQIYRYIITISEVKQEADVCLKKHFATWNTNKTVRGQRLNQKKNFQVEAKNTFEILLSSKKEEI
uniref:Uncharacterized protein n=1 Tax=Heterorhabditis bacteriophora TaxID=37862 RepID=A0A1I7X3K5_HETBA